MNVASWHTNCRKKCCSPELNGGGGWGIFNAILGWTNSATYGSVIAYNVYWIFVMAGFFVMRFHELKGHWPFMKPKTAQNGVVGSGSDAQFDDRVSDKASDKEKVPPTTKTVTASS